MIKMPWQIRRERDYWLKRAADLWAENRRLRADKVALLLALKRSKA